MNNQDSITTDILLDDLQQIGVQGTIKAYQNHIVPSKTLFDLYQQNSDNLSVILFLAAYSNTPSKLLIKIYENSSEVDVLCELAKHPRTSHEIMQDLARHPASIVRQTVAANRHITPQTANILAEDKEPYIRCLLAENPDLFQRLQLQLAEDPESFVRVALSQNRKPYNLLIDKLQKCEDPFVKVSLGTHPNLQNRNLLSLADSEDRTVQQAIFLRPEIPAEVLESLTFSPYTDISLKALKLKELTPDEMLGWTEDPSKKSFIAGLPDLPEAIQEVIAADDDLETLNELATNPCIADEAALMLIRRSVTEITLNLAANQNIGASVIKELCELQDTDIHKALALRNDLTENHLEILINRHQNLDVIYHLCLNNYKFQALTKELTKKLLKSELPTLRAFGACSDGLDQADMPRLSYDASAIVKMNLINNANVTMKILHFLGTDSNDDIAKAAQMKTNEWKKKQDELVAANIAGENIDEPAVTPKIISKLLDKLKGV